MFVLGQVQGISQATATCLRISEGGSFFVESAWLGFRGEHSFLKALNYLELLLAEEN
jgi:hypothetical protein